MANKDIERKQEIIDKLAAACLDATGDTLPETLRELLSSAKEKTGPVRDDNEIPPTDPEVRKYIYSHLFNFLSRERGVGHGAALIYPEELLTAVRELFPDGVKNYRPISGKRKRFHEVTLQELITEYKEHQREEE